MRSAMRLAVLTALILPPSAHGQYLPAARGTVRGQPYFEYEVVDSLRRRIRFYVSEAKGPGALPLVIYVHGSGHQSHFQRAGDRILPGNGHATLADLAQGRARVVIVEKPGVALYESLSTPATTAFRSEHTLERWAEAVGAAAIAARRLGGVDTSRMLLVGHSEGGLVAARVAARLREVTHVALLGGGGPSQLLDLLLLAREGTFFTRVSSDPATREAFVLAQWDSIRADPESADREFFGHPYRRWASFLRDSPLWELRRTSAKVFVAQGEADRAVARASFDMLAAELLAWGREPVIRLVPGADHSFVVRGSPPVDGWSAILGDILDWYSR